MIQSLGHLALCDITTRWAISPSATLPIRWDTSPSAMLSIRMASACCDIIDLHGVCPLQYYRFAWRLPAVTLSIRMAYSPLRSRHRMADALCNRISLRSI
jgi:hypothetical protein